ncbi:MAG: hypothetical protein Q4D98_04135 [Planctomycetia bacterium]|nr:hypothetical protein [Planctomycetia bacterium]
MKEKNWEKRLRRDAQALDEKFSPEIHRSVMARIRREPEPAKRREFAPQRVLVTVCAATVCIAALCVVFPSYRPSLESPEAKPTVATPTSEVVRFFAPCGEPIRAVAETTGVPIRSISEEQLPVPEKEQLGMLWKDTQTFLNDQIVWVME